MSLPTPDPHDIVKLDGKTYLSQDIVETMIRNSVLMLIHKVGSQLPEDTPWGDKVPPEEYERGWREYRQAVLQMLREEQKEQMGG